MTNIPSIKSFVTSEPLFLENGVEIPGHVANTTEDGRVVGIVRQSYTIIQMNDILSDIETAIEKLDVDRNRIEQRDIVSRNGSYVAREYQLPTLKGIEYKHNKKGTNAGTKLAMFFRVSTSYDGSSPTRIRSGSLDLVCTNGMVTERDVENFSKRHTANVTIDRVRENLNGLTSSFEEQVGRLQQYAEIPLPKESELRDILAGTKMTSKMIDRLIHRTSIETSTRGDNVYSLLSAMTYYSSHESDDFPLYQKRDGNVRDNVPELLSAREENVRTWVSSKPFRDLLAA